MTSPTLNPDPGPRAQIRWKCRDRDLSLGERTLVMGILNVTPDSFSDGGAYLDPAKAVDHGLAMAAEGADIIDIGGESTRPQAEPVTIEEEMKRVLPVVEGLAAASDTLISIDTRKAQVADEAIRRGAHIINDVSACTHDPEMEKIAAQSGAGVVLMHMRGEPGSMQDNPSYDDVLSDIYQYLEGRIGLLGRVLDPDQLAIDPGIGFGKTAEHNLALLRGVSVFSELNRPILMGVSRKSFLGYVLGREVDDRMAGSLGVLAWCVLNGVHMVRVHDVKESCDVSRMLGILRQERAQRVIAKPD